MTSLIGGDTVNWIFWAFVGAAAIHVVEEFGYPGGFLETMRRFSPRFAPAVTTRLAVVVNGLFLLLCITGAIIGGRSPFLGLSIASLLFFNALMHIGGSIRARGYAPGLVSGILLYLPFSSYAVYLLGASGRLTLTESIAAGLLGVLYQTMPLGCLALSTTGQRSGRRHET
jgi:hypothetical protein